ncbi:MAG TPA: septal ring lytic transglycosylase RlpA family protein [Longimicrobiales bacterium]|nr:septal ring lytic transglycosylase RlpA family protein [Longimicrobiales bacterium]
MEKTRILIGGLLILAALALGAGAPASSAPTPAVDVVPLADPAVPAAPADRPARSARADAAASSERETGESEAAADVLAVMEGGASWYSDALAGRRTASGERYDPTELIAAHPALPFGTRLRVTNLDNDRSVEVRVIDRGPFVAGRVLDLSRSAAERIGMIRAGHVRVRIEVLQYGV